VLLVNLRPKPAMQLTTLSVLDAPLAVRVSMRTLPAPSTLTLFVGHVPQDVSLAMPRTRVLAATARCICMKALVIPRALQIRLQTARPNLVAAAIPHAPHVPLDRLASNVSPALHRIDSLLVPVFHDARGLDSGMAPPVQHVTIRATLAWVSLPMSVPHALLVACSLIALAMLVEFAPWVQLRQWKRRRALLARSIAFDVATLQRVWSATQQHPLSRADVSRLAQVDSPSILSRNNNIFCAPI